jgi:hypothetical protein
MRFKLEGRKVEVSTVMLNFVLFENANAPISTTLKPE